MSHDLQIPNPDKVMASYERLVECCNKVFWSADQISQIPTMNLAIGGSNRLLTAFGKVAQDLKEAKSVAEEQHQTVVQFNRNYHDANDDVGLE